MNLNSVYKTMKGRKYHCDENCIYIKKRTTPIALKDVKNRLDPCIICSPPQTNGELIVYKTRTGRKYHMSNCNSINRRAISITVNDDGYDGLEPCKKCC